ncbi:MAG: tRNA adenosine(34) deaminase TadA [Candidatus Electrothrix aestuarii]|uniref:tRNA-specific adenosine deaminase n=1 Tax=Candidatus Electrothrix aestuarii TaxID=3062594 RepID=A0AAU8M120_9BACT|nr:tRNA adenosine(34) deaminase TadA [Candidatus Electrothrix aestuarii]
MKREEQEARDFYCMGKALDFAAYAATQEEVPVGAVLVDRDYEIIAGAGNNCIRAHDPTGHAEIHTLRSAADKLGNYRLPETTMYVTLEPCPMCAAAMIQARVERIVFGAIDSKGGGLQSLYTIGSDGKLNHRFAITGGVRAEECATLLKDFFRRRRKKG